MLHELGSRATGFAVVDVETTGFSPRLHDRVLEIAVVRLSPVGSAASEFTTLVNPARDVGPTHVHGITAGDIRDAPTFEDVAGDIASLIDGAVLVAHNLRFDRSFLAAEFARTLTTLPELPGVCTLDLAYRLEPKGATRKLIECCRRNGITYTQEHCALEDARATAHLLIAYLQRAADRGMATLSALGCSPLEMPEAGWHALVPSGRSWQRSAASDRAREERGYLARLVERLPGTDAHDAGTAAYLDLLDRALADRRVTQVEADELMRIADEWQLSRADIHEAHRGYLAGLTIIARADGVVSAAERADLEAVRDMLGLHTSSLEVLLSAAATAAPAIATTAADHLKGKTVCFTGELRGRLDGRLITREQAEELATRAGMRAVGSVTRKLDILVVADPDTMSSKARLARERGVRILAEAVFWSAIGVQVG